MRRPESGQENLAEPRRAVSNGNWTVEDLTSARHVGIHGGGAKTELAKMMAR